MLKKDSDSTSHISLMACIFWQIWKSRNEALFEGKAPNPMQTILKATTLHQEHMMPTNEQNNWQNRAGTCEKGNAPWKPPPANHLKLNVDAAWSKENPINTIAGLLRDRGGVVVSGFAKSVHAPSLLTAEALAVREALLLASNLELKHIIIESDNLQLIKACRESGSIGQIWNILRDIHSLRRGFEECTFSWRPRDGNQAAHELAAATATYSLPPNWFCHRTPSLNRALNRDIQGLKTQHQYNTDPSGAHITRSDIVSLGAQPP
ncbi:uncharacterized protein LOC130713137 [Lotus japonicus]|uniref:uncharacterized protein LOC130713137 n=1 Tax=Lotus japonicus TaxID=34305 RepID=UPI002585CADF|nr:uncharacterized protein LOC130713137 [Lotus japonicus]